MDAEDLISQDIEEGGGMSTGGIVAVASAAGLALMGGAHVAYRLLLQRKGERKDLSEVEVEKKPTQESEDTDADATATGHDLEVVATEEGTTDAAENPLASDSTTPATADKEKETEQVVMKIAKASQFQPDEELKKKTTVEAAKEARRMFPDLVKENEVQSYRSLSDLKEDLHRKINGRLDSFSSKYSSKGLNLLMERRHGERLCRVLGMNEKVIKRKFESQRNFDAELERAFGEVAVGTMPFLYAVQHLVDTIELESPYGEPTDGSIEEKYNGKSWLHYLGIEIKMGSLRETVDTVNEILVVAGLVDADMHSTTAAALDEIARDSGGGFNLSTGNHDLGPGLYVFRKQIAPSLPPQLVLALSWAVDRSWPRLDQNGQFLDGKGKFRRQDNPAIVVFRRPLEALNDIEITDVSLQAPFTEDQLKLKLGERYNEFQEIRSKWSEENFNWKQFVMLARRFRLVPAGKEAFCGLLHKGSSVKDTDKGTEPEPDSDGWIQHCFRNPQDAFGYDMLFIEFHIDDWATWFNGKEIDYKHSEKRKDEMDEFISHYEPRDKNTAGEVPTMFNTNTDTTNTTSEVPTTSSANTSNTPSSPPSSTAPSTAPIETDNNTLTCTFFQSIGLRDASEQEAAMQCCRTHLVSTVAKLRVVAEMGYLPELFPQVGIRSPVELWSEKEQNMQ